LEEKEKKKKEKHTPFIALWALNRQRGERKNVSYNCCGLKQKIGATATIFIQRGEEERKRI